MKIPLSQVRFPWKIFSRVIVIQAISILILFFISGFSARRFFRNHILEQARLHLQEELVSVTEALTSVPSWKPIAGGNCQLSHHLPHSMSLQIDKGQTLICQTSPNMPVDPPEFVEESMKFRGYTFKARLELPELHQTLQFYDSALALYLAAVGTLLIAFAILFARRLVFPIGRMLVKTRSVLHQKPYEMRELDQEPYGEWSDLESSIEEIRRDLETKIESLKTEREEQATLMSAISDAILAIDQDGAPLFYNSRSALLFGDKELGTHQRLWEILRNPEILEAFRQSLREGKITSVKAIPFDQPTGKRFFSLSISPLRKDKESVYGAVGIFHDVTDLKRAEQIRIDFVANVSHELRTPLTAIKGYADTLREDLLAGRPPTQEFLEVIIRNTDRLMSLIHDLLDLSSLESIHSLQKLPVKTEEITQRVLNQMKDVLSKKKQKVEVHCESAMVSADPRRLEQVLINLLENANKYTPTGCQIKVLWELDSNSNSTLKIIDKGPGIPQEHHDRLFERFYRVDKARSREQGGTGLGLAIVKHIMQGHGGSISVESTPGHGATFICRFPP